MRPFRRPPWGAFLFLSFFCGCNFSIGPLWGDDDQPECGNGIVEILA